MMRLLTVVFLALTSTKAHKLCQTPSRNLGECVLITQCPHLLAALQNQTNFVSQDYIRQSHCGFESIYLPKVCCPIENVLRPSPKCGLHTPEGEQDPWLALISYEKADGSRAFLCGGVLIHKRYVLTAAHCVKGENIPKNAKIASVRFGDFNANPPMEIQVENVMVHENYNRHSHHDVALIRLKKKVTFKNGEIRPICLPMNNGKTVEGNFQLAGWKGVSNQRENFTKQAGLAMVWNKSECHLWYNNTGFKLGESHVCAEGRKRPYLPKHGINVGGILMDVNKDSYSVVGISSSQPACCKGEDHPNLYTRVSEYGNWIFSNIDI